MEEYIASFLTGGIIVGGAKYVAQRSSPLWASLLGSTPNDIFTPYFLDGENMKKEYIIGYIFQSVVFICLTVSLYFLLKYTSINADLLIGTSIIIWLGLSVILIKYTKPLIKQHFQK